MGVLLCHQSLSRIIKDVVITSCNCPLPVHLMMQRKGHVRCSWSSWSMQHVGSANDTAWAQSAPLATHSLL